jgi:hypothetical protein
MKALCSAHSDPLRDVSMFLTVIGKIDQSLFLLSPLLQLQTHSKAVRNHDNVIIIFCPLLIRLRPVHICIV